MAIFNKPDKQANIQTNATVISSSTVIEGSITSRCPVHIDGNHQGTINAESTVVVGRSGTVKGDLTADRLTVTGVFEGTADCENIEILAGGTLKGKVVSNHLTIDQNCTFEGESIKKQAANSAKPMLTNQKVRAVIEEKSKAS